jgi:hypothetical protein
MTTSPRTFQASAILREVAEALDITPSQRERAIESYTKLGEFLCEPGTLLAPFSPSVYPQGSFEIGTVTKPLHRDEDFDLDAVCRVNTTTSRHTQAQVKDMLGLRLNQSPNYSRMLQPEKRRCWRLDYAEATKFHMDLLPAIPDDGNYLIAQGINPAYCEAPICLTDNKESDNKSSNYYQLHARWHRSNPKGYAIWFREQMAVQLAEALQARALEVRMSVDEVSFYEVKTPLQRAIQLMKRHRSKTYGQDEDRPISIIITTLAARAYADHPETDLYEALTTLLDRMPYYIEKKVIKGKEVDWIGSPVTPFENYADKWIETPRKRLLFYQWLTLAKSDFTNAFAKHGLGAIGTDLKACLGDRVVERALSNYGQQFNNARTQGGLYVAPATGTLNTSGQGKQVKDHRFYGH